MAQYGEDASPIDAYVWYTNEIAQFLEDKGFTVRVFSDAFYRYDTNQTVDLKPSIEVDYWTRMFPDQATIQTYIDKGHKVMNLFDKADPLMSDPSTMTHSFMYYVNEQRMYAHPQGEEIYAYWHPGLFSNWSLTGCPKQEYEKDAYPEALLGACFCIWNDTMSEAEEDTTVGIAGPLAAMSAICWDKNTNTKYADYEDFKSSSIDLESWPGYTENLSLGTITTDGTVSLKSYEVKAGSWSVDANTRLFIVADGSEKDENLSQFALLAAAELEETTGLEISVVSGSEDKVTESDIALSLEYESTSGMDEEYAIAIDRDGVLIKGASARGILYGLRTLENLLSDGTAAAAEITDYPDVAERALHIDCGRKYYTKDWIISRIKQMSLLKMNTIELHFSEDEGFRLESKTHPEIVSDEYLTYEEMEEIIGTAKLYGVDVVPSLDAPGHVTQMLINYPEYQIDKLVTDEEGNVVTDENGDPVTVKDEGALDITNPEAVAFIEELYEEYAGLFKDSTTFNIGCDEFVDFGSLDLYPAMGEFAVAQYGEDASPIDAYVWYTNKIASFLEDKGFTVRVFSDAFYRYDTNQTVDLKSSIEVDYWTRMFPTQAEIQTYIDKGHKVMNLCDKADPLMTDMATFTHSFMYYVNSQFMYAHPQGNEIYAYWHPGLFSNWSGTGCPKQEYEKDAYPEALLGACFCIWNDKMDEEEEDTTVGIAEPLNAMAAICWNKYTNTSYKDYDQFLVSSQKIDGWPGYSETLSLGTVTVLTDPEDPKEPEKPAEPEKPEDPKEPEKPVKTETVEMYRLYNPNSGEHFYTSSAYEKNYLIKEGWKDEGTGWLSPKKSDTPVYRLYNPNAGDHHYTTDAHERSVLMKEGWRDEGIGWYSAEDEDAVPVLRQYNPNSEAGNHNFTVSEHEHNSLVSKGWRNEGIAWMACSSK